MSKIKLSKSQWEQIGRVAGWIKTAQFGPGFVEDLGSQTWKERFGKKVTTEINVNGTPLVMSAQIGDDGIVAIVEHNGEHIGVYDPKRDGFQCTYTKHIDKYDMYKEVIDKRAEIVIQDFVAVDPMCENCGGGSHHTEECPYSFGANPQ